LYVYKSHLKKFTYSKSYLFLNIFKVQKRAQWWSPCEPSGSMKNGGIVWLAERLLASQEGVCFMELNTRNYLQK